MNIKGFKLVLNGMSGSEVEYDDNKSVDSLTFSNSFTERHKAPVPIELVNRMNSLKIYLLKLTGHWVERYNDHVDYGTMSVINASNNPGEDYFVVQNLVRSVSMTKVRYDGNKVELYGKMTIGIGDKVVNLKSPSIDQADDYKYYDAICAILRDCFVSVKSYVNGDLILDNKQFVKDFYLNQGKTIEESEELLSHMSDDERMEFMREGLEKMGLIVLDSVDDVLPGLGEPSELEDESVKVCDDDDFNDDDFDVEPTVEAADKAQAVNMDEEQF